MKKYLLVLFIVLVFSSLAFAILDITHLGLQGPGGSSNIVYGETVRVKAVTDPLLPTPYGFYVNEPTVNQVMVHYYDEQDPAHENSEYLGSEVHPVENIKSFSSTSSSWITGTFTLLESPTGIAKSIQVMLGVWAGESIEYGPIVCSYIPVGEYSAINNGPLDFFVYLDNEGSPLPVTLSSFTAQFTNGKPTLYWTTQSETNNAYWNIYRSISQNMGQAIQINYGDMILGQGTVTEPTYYSYTDNFPVLENTTYWYWLESVDDGGETEMFGPISLTVPLGGGNNGTPAMPDDYGLKQNFPNPFNPDTRINFALGYNSQVQLTIYNIKGEKVKTIFEGYVERNDDGETFVQTAYWDGKDKNGKYVGTGVYLYRLRTNKTDYMKRMLLMK
jgi:hypothetical protein